MQSANTLCKRDVKAPAAIWAYLKAKKQQHCVAMHANLLQPGCRSDSLSLRRRTSRSAKCADTRRTWKASAPGLILQLLPQPISTGNHLQCSKFWEECANQQMPLMLYIGSADGNASVSCRCSDCRSELSFATCACQRSPRKSRCTCRSWQHIS